MAKRFVCRLGVAQISVNPAYVDEFVNWIQEPYFPSQDEKIGLFTIAGIEEITSLRERISEQYIGNLNCKIEALIRFASACRVELLIFPEYSVPPESLLVCHRLSNELGMAIVAGSHVVTTRPAAQRVYKDLQLRFDGSGRPEEKIRQAACVVFQPQKTPLAFTKYVRSKWETCLVPGNVALHTFEMATKAGKLEVQILICIEALTEPLPKEKHSVSRLVVIPAFSPSTDDFYKRAELFLTNGKCTLFANVAELGNSRVFARTEKANFWDTQKDGNVGIRRPAEALIVLEADLERQFEIRKSTEEHTAVSDLRVYPLLYPADSVETASYAEMVELCLASKPSVEEIRNQVLPFTSLSSKVFPSLLSEKLQYFVGHVAPAGVVSGDEAINWIKPIIVPDVPSTDKLRWGLCNQAIEAVSQLQLSSKHVSKAKELMEVYSHLVVRRNELMQSIQPHEQPKSGATLQPEVLGRAAPTESPFIDRDSAFDKIREFINQPQYSAFILGGMRGIGKSALISESFRQALPPKRSIRMQLTDGMSYPRLLAQLAYSCNLQIPENLDLSTRPKQEELERRILSFMSQGPGVIVVLDEFQYLLNGSGEVEDPSVRQLLGSLLEGNGQTRSKYILISHISPRLGPEIDSHCMGYSLQGLQTRDTERLLLYWFHYRREDLAGQFTRPPDKIVSLLGGHPLAIYFAARLWADHPSEDISEEMSIFKDFRDTIVSFILEKISLLQPEIEFLSFASIFRIPVTREAFVRWRGEEASALLNSLTNQYLVESSEKGYQLHPLVRDFYYHSLQPAQFVEYHKIAGKFYLHEFQRYRNMNKQIVPEYLGEATHHYLAAGDKNKVEGFAFYKQELKPVAIEHYRRHDYKTALKDYQVLVELDDRDVDAHFHLALIYARQDKWEDAEFHFGKAIGLQRNAHWIFQAFGAAKLHGGKRAEGESLLLQAEKINPRHAPTLVEIGHLRETDGDVESAEEYYRRAIEADSNSALAYFRLARLLYREGDISQAYAIAKLALACRPLDNRNKELVDELKKRIDESDNQTNA